MKNHVIVGVSGDDLDIPGYLEAHDPETGEMQWRWYVVPQKKGDPGSETWPNEEAMKHGGGMTWQPVTYDPELNLIYVTTGNPQPVIAHKNRAGRQPLHRRRSSRSIPTPARWSWYFQSSPHDTHDWDATQTPVLFDGEINGQPRKLLAQAARNGHFFVLDRTNGKAHRLVRVREDELVARATTRRGSRFRTRRRSAGRRRARVAEPGRRDELAAAELQPADRAVLRQRRARLQRLLHLRSRARIRRAGAAPIAAAGRSRCSRRSTTRPARSSWSHKWEGDRRVRACSAPPATCCSPAGRRTTSSRSNATTGEALWHARLNSAVSNGPITYELDGTQYVVVGAGDTLWAFAMQHDERKSAPASK